METGQCAVCKADQNLRNCSRCKTRKYCSTECQKKDWPSHKDNCKAENFILKISLCPGDIVDPPVRRTLSCPYSSTFLDLHIAIQIAFDWAGTHAFDFSIKDPNAEPEPVLDVNDMIKKYMSASGRGPQMDEGPPQNLLRIVSGSRHGIDRMHERFRTHSRTSEIPAGRIRFGKTMESKEYKGAPLEYDYDFGDGWKHHIEIIGRAPATNTFICTAGEGHGVAEDVGSLEGWQKLKEAYRTQSPNKEQKDKMQWFERMCSNKDSHGLGGERVHMWDQIGVNFKLSRM